MYGEAARIVIKFYFPASCGCPILALYHFDLDLPEKIHFVGEQATEAIGLTIIIHGQTRIITMITSTKCLQ